MSFLGIIGTHINSQSNEAQSVRLLGMLTIPVYERKERLPQIKKAIGVDELVYLATCNRIEFIISADRPLKITEIRNKLLDIFFQGKSDIFFSPNDFYTKSGLDAGRHLFTVASALDSLVIGEAQILGQVKDAFSFSVENGLIGEQLTPVFQRVFRVAKKVRTETELGKKSVSMVSLAASLIQKSIADEKDITIALIGVGAMTHKMAKFLIGKGMRNLIFVNRTKERADALAGKFGGTSMALDEFLTNPPRVRMICSATSSSSPIFTDETILPLLAKNEKLLCIDLAIPNDIEIKKPVDNCLEIYDISDLKKISEQNRRQRFRDVDKAQSIIAEEVLRFHQRIVESELKPVFNLSYQEANEYAEKGLERLFEKSLSHLNDDDKAHIRHLVNKIVGYSTYLPARTIANRIAMKNENGIKAKHMLGTRDTNGVKTFRKGA